MFEKFDNPKSGKFVEEIRRLTFSYPILFLPRFLLKRLFHYLPMTEAQALQSSAALKSLAANFQGKLPPTVLGPVHPGAQLPAPPPVNTQPQPQPPSKKKKKPPGDGINKKSPEVSYRDMHQKQNASGTFTILCKLVLSYAMIVS